MKRGFFLCVLLVMFCSFASATIAERETFTSGDFQYFIRDDGTAEIIKYTGDADKLVIPSSIDSYLVTSIGANAFFGLRNLTDITIPDSLISIGESAFEYCHSLTSITIPESVTSIGDDAFNNCESMRGINVSSGNNCYSSINGVLFDKARTIIMKYPSSLKGAYTIPFGVVGIGDDAFYGCVDLTSITIPDSVTSIGDYAFRACDSLTSITIPNSVISIGEGAFSICYNLTDITLSNNVSSISAETFSSCKFTNIMIPDSVTSIGDHAFYCCSSLTSITIPDNVTSIGEEAFSYCSRLTSVSLPEGLTSIGYFAFHGCESLTNISLPNSITSIEDEVFSFCSSLMSVTLPDNLINIGEGAFVGCDSLTCIAIPNSVTSIGDGAFEWCSRLRNVTIPNRITSIGNDVFSECSNDLTIICGVSSKAQEYAETNEIDFFLLNSTASTEEDWNWIPDDNDCAVIISYIGNSTETVVPASLGGYPVKTLSGFAGGENITTLTLSDGIETIEEQFSLRRLETLILPGSVHTIGDSAFRTMGRLKTVLFTGDGLRKIDSYAFERCNLERLSLPDTLEYIGNYAFEAGLETTDLILPAHLSTIGNGAFYYCFDLETVRFGPELRSIGGQAFYNCSRLKELYFPDGLVTIGRDCFYDCEALTSVHLPETLESLGGSAFGRCSSLTAINLPRSLACPDENPFPGCKNLKEIVLDDDHPTMSLKENALLSADGKRLIAVFESRSSRTMVFETPAEVTEIGARAFTSIPFETVILSPNVEVIDSYAFAGALLKRVIVQGHLSRISDCAFIGVPLDLYLMDGVDLIETAVFYNSEQFGVFYCKGDIGLLQEGSFRNTEWSGFEVDGCIREVEPGALTGMRTYYFTITGGIQSGEIPCVMDINGNTAKIREGNECLGPMIQAGIAGTHVEIIELPSSLTAISGNPFSSYPELKEIRVPDDSPFRFRDGALIRKEDGLMIGTALGAVSNIYIIPEDARTIGVGALDGLEAAILRGNVTNVLYNPKDTQLLLDKECPLIRNDREILSADGKRLISFIQQDYPVKTYRVPEGVEIIGQNALRSAKVQNVVLPESLRTIEKAAFMQSLLQSIVLSAQLQTIENYAFAYCENLQALYLPETIVSFHESAICGCSALRYFEMPACVTELSHVGALDADSPNGLVILHNDINYIAEDTDIFPQRDYFFFEFGGPLFAIADGSFVHEYYVSHGYYPQYYMILGESLRHTPTPDERVLDCDHEWIYRLLDDGTAEIMGYCGESDTLMLPDELDGHPVASFALSYPFLLDSSRVKEIHLLRSIRKIDYYSMNNFFKGGTALFMDEDSFAYRWCLTAGMIN